MNISIEGNVAVVTGGGGAICGEIAYAFAGEGISVAVWDLSCEAAQKITEKIIAAGGKAIACACDVTDAAEVSKALAATLEQFGTVDILVNGAGGSRRETTTSAEKTFFDILPYDMQNVLALNYLSAVFTSQAIGKILGEKKNGSIINIASIAGILPLTRAVTYSDGKAAVVSFTRWLAVHMAQNYSPRIRVNAIAPGFILTQQNKFLLVDEQSGQLTERGKEVLNFVPTGRYGKPEEIVGTALWLVSEAASFVTGAVIPVDGGFTAFAGV